MAGGNIVGRIGIKVAPDTSGFDEKLKKDLEDTEKKNALQIPVDPKRGTDFSGKLKKVVDDSQAQIDSKNIRLKIGIDTKDSDLTRSATDATKDANKDLESKGTKLLVPMEADSDHLASQLKDAIKRAKASLSKDDLQLKFTAAFDTLKAKQDIDHFVRDINGTHLNFKADLDRQNTVKAEVDLLTRNRSLDIAVRIEKRSLAVAEGTIASLFGLNVLQESGRSLEKFATNIDSFALSFAQIGTKFATITSGALASVSSITGVLSSLGAIGGFAAGLPAAAGAIGAFVLVNVAAFKNFGAAINGSADAMKQLPVNAQGAARALHGTWTEMQRPIQNAFWSQLNGVFEDLVNKTLPGVTVGLTAVGVAAGDFTRQIISAFTEQGGTGIFATMFTQMAQGLKNANAGIRPFMGAIIELTSVGAALLPKVGTYLAQAAGTFSSWIAQSAQSGKLTSWMNNAATQAGNLGRVFTNVKGIFSALTEAARTGGSGNLATFADFLGKVRSALQGPAFQSAISTLFAGAHDAIASVRGGLKDILQFLQGAAPQISSILKISGRTVGGLLTDIAKAASDPVFKTGLVAFFQGVSDGVKSLGKYLPNVAVALGNVGDLLGSVFKGLGPILGKGAGGISDAFTSISGALKDLVPILLGFSDSTVSVLIQALNLLAVPLKVIIEGFEKLPGVVQNAILALLLLRKFSGSGAILGGGPITPFRKALQQLPKDAQASMAGVRSAVAKPIAIGGLRTSGNGVIPASSIMPAPKVLASQLSANVAAMRLPSGLLTTQASNLGRDVSTRMASSIGTGLPVALRGVNLSSVATGISRQVTSPLTQGLTTGIRTAASDGLRSGLILPRSSGIFVPTTANLRSAISQGATLGMTSGLRLNSSAAAAAVSPLRSALKSGVSLGLASGLRLPASATGNLTALSRQISTAATSSIKTAEQGALARAFVLPAGAGSSAKISGQTIGTNIANGTRAGLAGLPIIVSGATSSALKGIPTAAQNAVRSSNANLKGFGATLPVAAGAAAVQTETRMASMLGKVSGGFKSMFGLIGGGWGLAFIGGLLLFQKIQANADELKASAASATQAFKDMASAAGNAGEGIVGPAAQKAATDYLTTIKDIATLNISTGKSSLFSLDVSGASKGSSQTLEQLINNVGLTDGDITDVMQGKGSDAAKQFLQGLDTDLNNSKGTWVTRLFNGSQQAAATAQIGVKQILGDSKDATDALNVLWSSDGNRGQLIVAGLKAVETATHSPVTVDNINTLKGSLDHLSTDGGSNINTFGKTFAASLGGTAQESTRNFGIINAALAGYDKKTGLIAGRNPIEEIVQQLTAAGEPVANIQSTLEDFGYSTDQVASALSLRFGPAVDGAGKAIKVFTNGVPAQVPKMSQFSSGVSEMANALGSVSGVDTGKLINAISLNGYDPSKLASGLASQGVSMDGIQKVMDALGVTGPAAATAMQAAAQSAQALASSATLTGLEDFQTTMDGIAKSTDTAATKAGALYDAIQTLLGNPLDSWKVEAAGNKSLENAVTSINDAKKQAGALQGINFLDNTGTELTGKALVAAIAKVKFSTADLNGFLKGTGPLVDTVGSAFEDLSKNELAVAKNAFDNVIKAGGGLPAAMKAAGDSTNPFEKQINKMIKDLGFTDTQAAAVRTTFGLLGKTSVVATVTASTAGATGPLATVLVGLTTVKKGGSFTVHGLTADAVTKLQALGLKVTLLANGDYKIGVGANTKAAVTGVANLIANTNGRTANIHVGVATPSTAAARDRIASLNGVQVRVGVSANLSSAQNSINGLNGQTVEIKAHLVAGPGGGLRLNEDGAVYPHVYANGGFYKQPQVQQFASGTENHVAQIAKGTYRLWAEPETGGEAYIPLAAEKRARSTAILEDVANRFGYSLERLGGELRSYEVGGTTIESNGSAVAGSGITVNQYYPIAEKTSVSVARAAALQQNLGLISA